jgi:5-formyltetrahydrofolate cyclo-ligase
MRAERRAHVEALHEATRALILMRPPAPVAELAPQGSVVGLYFANRFEAPTGGYARWLYENGRKLALPAFDSRDAPMHFREWSDPIGSSDLVAGPYGNQPDDAAERVTPDVVFVPLLGFTASGERLGQGGGHYDRWLADHPKVPCIGLAWDMQLVDSLPLEPHDRQLTAIVTPTRIYRSET